MRVKKVKGGYRVETRVCGYSFCKNYYGYNRAQAIIKHSQVMLDALHYGCNWIDIEKFNEYC